MGKCNCWEYMNCGKETAGNGNGNGSVCPIAHDALADTLNGGVNGGRICWIIADMKYNNNIQCSATHHKSSCFSCSFRYKVTMDEGLLNVCNATGTFLTKIYDGEEEVSEKIKAQAE